ALVCSAFRSAGAITSANSTGVKRGTMSSRGVRAVRVNRRRTSVASAWRLMKAGGLRATGTGEARVDMCVRSPSRSGGRGDAVAGEAQVDVVEGGRAAADRGHGQPDAVDRGDRISGGAIAEGDGERRADHERAVVGDALCLQDGEAGLC